VERVQVSLQSSPVLAKTEDDAWADLAAIALAFE
jgi:hypothetical protein